MTYDIKRPNWKIYIGIPVLIFFSCYLITCLTIFKGNSQILSMAIIGDLLITAPLMYLFLIRKSSISKLTVLRVVLVGILIAGAILNTQSNYLIHILKTWLSPMIESTLIFIIARKFYLANKEAKIKGQDKVDFLNHCRKVLTNVMGNKKAGEIISSEIAVFYYAFISKKEKNIDNTYRFSSYKKNGVILILSTFLSLFLLETIGVHFLLMLWNKVFAWVFTGLSIYSCLQLYAHIKSIRARVIRIKDEGIGLYMGLAADVYIDIANIEKIEITSKQCNDDNTIKLALIKGLEGHNMRIKLKNPVEVIKMFGIKKQAQTILFFVDQPKEFLNSVKIKLAETVS